MRLIVLSGHTRPVTKVVFNRDGDLLFTAAKDTSPTVWYANTGERLGTYNGHTGAVFDIDVDFHSKHLLTGSGDQSVKIWNVENGKELHSYIPSKNRVSQCKWACGDKLFFAATPKALGEDAMVHIYRNPETSDMVTEEKDNGEPLASIPLECNSKELLIGGALWSPTNSHIFVCCDDGIIRILDVTKETQVQSVIFDSTPKDNKNKSIAGDSLNLTDMAISKDLCNIGVSSRNYQAKLFDIFNWNCLKTYDTDRPLNTICFHPKLNSIVMGGGESAVQTALEGRETKYEPLFYHTIFGERIGKISADQFSPLNTITFSPDGSLLCAGYEEGTARLFRMDDDFEKKYKKSEKKYTAESL